VHDRFGGPVICPRSKNGYRHAAGFASIQSRTGCWCWSPGCKSSASRASPRFCTPPILSRTRAGGRVTPFSAPRNPAILSRTGGHGHGLADLLLRESFP